MYEPKYKLNTKDEARYRSLVIRECVEAGKPDKKYPPLSPAERLELERLDRKRHRKIRSHPDVKRCIDASNRKTRKLAKICKALGHFNDVAKDPNHTHEQLKEALDALGALMPKRRKKNETESKGIVDKKA